MFMLRLALAAICLGVCLSGDAIAQREFAPGVLKVIEPKIDGRDAATLPMPLPGLEGDLAPENYVPNFPARTETLYGQTRQIIFYRDVWQHEFAFLGLRQMKVSATDENGQVVERDVWYLPYRIRNVGAAITHTPVTDPNTGRVDYVPNTETGQPADYTLSNRFFGRFTLHGWIEDAETGMYTEVVYADQVSPGIVQMIQDEEDPGRPLIDKVKLTQQILQRVPADSSEGGVWSVAVWYNVDPSIDFVSVRVTGLTNAYRIVVNPDGSLDFRYKTLQLNFWRPGDGVQQDQDKTVFGIPLTDDPLRQIEIARKYRLPGPVIRGEILDQDTLRATLIFETDADLDQITFESGVAKQLDAGQIPDTVSSAFDNAGITLGDDASLTRTVSGQQWTVNDTWEGVPRIFVIKLQPDFWEKSGETGIRFIRSIDSLWIYE
ncbi:MAG: hypothetical protein ACR2NP_05080 [Pirellulaceae bacterium]